MRNKSILEIAYVSIGLKDAGSYSAYEVLLGEVSDGGACMLGT